MTGVLNVCVYLPILLYLYIVSFHVNEKNENYREMEAKSEGRSGREKKENLRIY